MNWTEASIVVDRFIRLMDADLNELKQKHVLIKQYEREHDHERAAVGKSQSDRLIHQIQKALQTVMSIRRELSDSPRCQFDARIEPVRLRIQATLSAISSATKEVENPFKPSGKPSKNPFQEEDNLFEDCFQEETSSSSTMPSDYEWQLLQEQRQSHKSSEALRLQLEQAKMNADATKKLETDIEDLNQIMVDLAKLVHEQHEIVDSIEEQVERTAHDVEQSNKHLKQAVRTNQAKYPVVAAAAGSVIVGGPVGVVAGSAVAGILAAIGGAAAGLWGGRAIRQKTVEENTEPKQ